MVRAEKRCYHKTPFFVTHLACAKCMRIRVRMFRVPPHPTKISTRAPEKITSGKNTTLPVKLKPEIRVGTLKPGGLVSLPPYYSPSLIALLIMVYRRIDTVSKTKSSALLQGRWRPKAVAERYSCHSSTVYRWEKRLQVYNDISPAYPSKRGRSKKINTAAKEALLEYQRRHPYAYQDELAIFLEEEWEIYVHRSTVARLLKKEQISRKKGELIGPRSQLLRSDWQTRMQDVVAEQLVFCDESIFKAQSAWRCMGYGPIGECSISSFSFCYSLKL